MLDVPSTPPNYEEFDRSGNDQATGPRSQVRLVAVAECCTYAVVDAAVGRVATGEQTLRAQLHHPAHPSMLVLAARNFYSQRGRGQVLATRAPC